MAEGHKHGIKWFEIAYAAVLIILLLVVAFLIQKPKVGVVNMKILASELGIDKKITTKVLERRQTASMRARRMQERFKADVEMFRERIEEARSDEEKEAIRKELTMLQQRTQQQIEEISSELTQYRDALVTDFRDRIQPIVQDVAKQKHLQVVLDTRGGIGVIHAAAKTDITSEVLEEARKQIYDLLPADEQAPALQPIAVAPAKAESTDKSE